MKNYVLAFIITTLAGMSTLLGSILMFFKYKNINKIISASLSFASGVMICISIFDLIPESFILLRDKYTLIITILYIILGILLGFIISSTIDKLLPNNSNNLFRVGIISMITIIIHNIPEGIATFITTTSSTTLGISLSIAIALHNIPEGISIAIPIYYSTKKKSIALLYTFISSVSETIGALIAFIFFRNNLNQLFLGFILSIIAGIMLQISFYELLPTAKAYNYLKLNIVSFIIGFIVMLITINLI